MHYISHYNSPLGEILLAADEKGLTGLWFEGAKYYARCLPVEHREGVLPVLEEAKRWLDIYFTGQEPDFVPTLHITGSGFQRDVWKILQEIPYGTITTYGAIAQKVVQQQNVQRMSAQAVGGAVGHNDIALIIPCHRVVGAKGNLTGYAGGVDKKAALLRLEGIEMSDNGIGALPMWSLAHPL